MLNTTEQSKTTTKPAGGSAARQGGGAGVQGHAAEAEARGRSRASAARASAACQDPALCLRPTAGPGIFRLPRLLPTRQGRAHARVPLETLHVPPQSPSSGPSPPGSARSLRPQDPLATSPFSPAAASTLRSPAFFSCLVAGLHPIPSPI